MSWGFMYIGVKGSSLYGEGRTFEYLNIMSWGLIYIGVKGTFLYAEGGTFLSLDIMWCGFLYIGVNGLFYVLRRRDICVTGCNVVGFYVHRCEWLMFCTEKEGHVGHWI